MEKRCRIDIGRLLKRAYRFFRPLNTRPITLSQPSVIGNQPVVTQLGTPLAVLILLPYLRVGGVEQVFFNLVTSLDRRRLRVFIGTTVRDKNPWKHRFEPFAERIYELSSLYARNGELANTLLRVVEDNRIASVHISHSLIGYRSLPLLKSHFPNLVTVDTLHMEEPDKPWDYFRYSQLFASYLDYRVVLTSNQARRLSAVYGQPENKIVVIPNGLNPNEYPFIVPKGQPSTIIFVGRFVNQKQPTQFVEVVEQLENNGMNLEYLMIGSGPLQATVLRKIASLGLTNKIRLLGDDHRLLREVSVKHPILVAPSLNEGLPMVGLEAMAYGIPVVAADVSGWRDLIEDGVDGFLVKSDDTDGFVDRVKLLCNRDLYLKIANNGRRKVEHKFTSQIMADAYQRIYAAQHCDIFQ